MRLIQGFYPLGKASWGKSAQKKTERGGKRTPFLYFSKEGEIAPFPFDLTMRRK